MEMADKSAKADLKSGLIDSPNKTQPQSAPDYSRQDTFTRGFTRTFTRTLTFAMGEDPDMDQIYTERLIESYQAHANAGVHGDVPLAPPFAQDIDFWKTAAITIFVGIFVGLVGLGFLNFVEVFPKYWINNFKWNGEDDTYFTCPACSFTQQLTDPASCACDKVSNMDFYKGQHYWIGMTTLGGLIVGLMRYFMKVPDDLPGLFAEIQHAHVDPLWCVPSILVSFVSLGMGLCLGPEAGLANFGGGLATYLVDKEVLTFKDPEKYKKIVVLTGMSAALGGLFPSPLLSVLMFHEMGHPPGYFMESTLLMSFGAISAFLTYYALVGKTYLSAASTPLIVSTLEIYYTLAYQWEFKIEDIGTAFAIGVVSSVIMLLIILFIGITKQILNRVRMRLAFNRFLQVVMPPVLAGLCVGCVNWALPMTVGNGDQTLGPIISYGCIHGDYSISLLVSSAFAKMFCLGMSMNAGFIGGFIYPMFTIACMFAAICMKYYPGMPVGLAIGAFMVGVPGGVVPAPFTFVALVCFIFYFGLYQTAAIYIASITSYTILSASGLLARLQSGAKGQAEGAAAAGGAHEKGPSMDKGKPALSPEEKAKQENYAIEQYMVSKKAPAPPIQRNQV